MKIRAGGRVERKSSLEKGAKMNLITWRGNKNRRQERRWSIWERKYCNIYWLDFHFFFILSIFLFAGMPMPSWPQNRWQACIPDSYIKREYNIACKSNASPNQQKNSTVFIQFFTVCYICCHALTVLTKDVWHSTMKCRNLEYVRSILCKKFTSSTQSTKKKIDSFFQSDIKSKNSFKTYLIFTYLSLLTKFLSLIDLGKNWLRHTSNKVTKTKVAFKLITIHRNTIRNESHCCNTSS